MGYLITRNSRRAISPFIAIALILACHLPLLAQSGGVFQITNSVIAAGGGESKDVVNNRFGHESTVGEHATGTLLQNPPYAQTAGFRASQIDVGPTASSASISGRILTIDGAPLAGVTINLAGTRTALAITDANGVYSFAGLDVGGVYIITPVRANYSFSPASRSFSLLANTTDAVFTAAASGGTANPLDTTEFFVRQHYLDFLGREPDATGLAFWIANVESCNQDMNCRAAKRVDTSAAFFLSIEFQQTGYQVILIYKSTYPDSPQHPRGFPRYREFLRDTQELGRDVVVLHGNWEFQLQQNKLNFARRWVANPDFLAQFPPGMGSGAYVDQLFSISSVTSTANERAAAIAAYGIGDTEGRAQALLSVTNSASVRDLHFNAAFVMMQYVGYLRRMPNDPPDNNFAGFDFWLGKLNQFNGDLQKAEMVKAFLLADEFRHRFGP